MHLLIGTDGRNWLPYGRDFTGHFGFSGSWEENVDHAVRSLGQVSLLISPRRFRIRLRPEALTWSAFQQLTYMLLDDDRKPVVLDFEGGGSTPTELYADVENAIARLDDLRAMNPMASGPQLRASYMNESLSLKRFESGSWQGLRKAYRAWARRRGQLDRVSLRKLLDAPFDAPFLLASVGRDGWPSVATWPAHIELYSREQADRLIGRSFHELPLHSYALRSAQGYRHADRTERPQLELIEAVVQPERGGPVRIRYDRLLLPWRASDGTRYVANLTRQNWKRASACPTC